MDNQNSEQNQIIEGTLQKEAIQSHVYDKPSPVNELLPQNSSTIDINDLLKQTEIKDPLMLMLIKQLQESQELNKKIQIQLEEQKKINDNVLSNKQYPSIQDRKLDLGEEPPKEKKIMNQEKNDVVIRKPIDETKFKEKKPEKKVSDFKLLSEEELQKKAYAAIELVQDYLSKLRDEDRYEVMEMKKKYPLRFCIIHQVLFDDDDSYTRHTIQHHQLIAKKEGLVKFQCKNCGEVFLKAGWLIKHTDACMGMDDVTSKLNQKQKKLLKLSKQMEHI